MDSSHDPWTCRVPGGGLWILRIILDLVAWIGSLQSHKSRGFQDLKFQNSLLNYASTGSLLSFIRAYLNLLSLSVVYPEAIWKSPG